MKLAFLYQRQRPNQKKANPDGIKDLCVMDEDGSSRQTLVTNVAWGAAAWSPDGKTIACEGFVEEKRSLIVVDTDGENLRCLSTGYNSCGPQWSPDGRFLAFYNFHKVWLVEVATGEHRVVAEQKGISNVRWHAGGNLYWNAWTNEEASPPLAGIFTAPASGGGPRLISPKSYNCGEFEISPDENLLAFRMGTGSSLLALACDGSRLWKLIDGAFVNNIVWSPDGQQLLVHLTQGEDSGLHILNLATGAKKRITGHYAFTATWTPDGKQIAYSSSNQKDETDLHVVDLETGKTRQLTTDRRSHYPVFQTLRRIGEIKPVPKLDWATLLVDSRKERKKTKALNRNFILVWAQFLADPETKPPFEIRVGIQSTPASGLRVLLDGNLYDCDNIPDGVDKLKTFIQHLGFPLADGFALIYPRYAVDDPSRESTLHFISGLIFEAAEANNWQFEREIPEPVWPQESG
ncbi:MAG: hypothetical protein K1Y36_08250 [Blastocatellia bacterium]|nr:hypothetical protein [Blastocatellia bacterium]